MRAFRILLVLAAFIAAPALAPAQQTESRITGRVLDQSQAALPGVTVTVTSKSTGAVRTDVTDGQAITDAQAGTFGYMLGPLNRTVGLGTARQTQISLRYSF